MQERKGSKGIVYLLTCACVDFCAAAVQQLQDEGKGATVFSLHGRMKQKARETRLAAFTAATSGVSPQLHWTIRCSVGCVSLRALYFLPPSQLPAQERDLSWRIHLLSLSYHRLSVQTHAAHACYCEHTINGGVTLPV